MTRTRRSRALPEPVAGRQLTARIELKLPSQLAYLGVPDAVLMEIGTDLDCPKKAIEELGTAVIEACTNAMEHGNKLRDDRQIEIRIDVEDGSLAVSVLDEGPGFDYSIWQPATDLLRERGRGILIMREFSDDLQYGRAPDGRFLVRLIKHLDLPA